jgi:hypothetical protein
MPYQNLSATLDDDVITQITAKLAEIEDLLPFLVTLSPAERKTLPKITSTSAFFVEDALAAAGADASFMPPYVSVAKLKKGLALFDQLEKVSLPLAKLASTVADTTTVAGSEAYVAALSFYNSVKRAAKDGAPGAQEIYERLSRRFEQSSDVSVEKPAKTA